MNILAESDDNLEYYYGELIVTSDTVFEDEDQYYEQGMNTYKRGGRRSENPYSSEQNPMRYAQWNQGYTDAIWNSDLEREYNSVDIDYYNQGWEAHRKQGRAARCPYEYNSRKYNEWFRGFLDADFDDEQCREMGY